MNNGEEIIHQFLRGYRVTPNRSTMLNMPPAELMFVKKIKSVYDKLLPIGKQKCCNKPNYKTKAFNIGDKMFFKSYWKGKCFWLDGEITKRIGRFVYMVCSLKWKNKRHINQLQRRYVEDQTRQEIQMEVLHDIFEMLIPQSVTTEESRSAKRCRERIN